MPRSTGDHVAASWRTYATASLSQSCVTPPTSHIRSCASIEYADHAFGGSPTESWGTSAGFVVSVKPDNVE